jgi:hypothetical protein
MTTVLQNTGTKLIFRQLDHGNAELSANLGGTYETVERTTQLMSEGLLGTSATGMESERPIDKYIGHPNVLKTLRTGRAFLIEASGKRAFVSIAPPAARGEGALQIRRCGPVERGPTLDLPRLVAEQRAKEQDEKRRAAEGTKAVADNAKASDKDKTDPAIAPVMEQQREPDGLLVEAAPVPEVAGVEKPKPRRIERPAVRARHAKK